MLASYGYIALFLVVALLFAGVTLLLPYLLSLSSRLRNNKTAARFLPPFMVTVSRIVPCNPSPVKSSAYECGMETIGTAWVQFNFRYYFYALIFLILDVLVVFLYPWAIGLRTLGYAGLVGAAVLIGIVAVGYVYAWRKKVLEWK
ncbi:MAG: NADH-quinone oxidoreductase subunit A [Chloroflexi bacterium]|nr:NADH-quinone oxidoreductase subunit A [Chloroflexota bacterium]